MTPSRVLMKGGGEFRGEDSKYHGVRDGPAFGVKVVNRISIPVKACRCIRTVDFDTMKVPGLSVRVNFFRVRADPFESG